MRALNMRCLGLWRFRLSLIQMCLASTLLFVAARQQDHYYQALERSSPVWEPDYAYNPPARLIALLVSGPGVLVPFGTHPYIPSAHLANVVSVVFISAFWFWIGGLIDRRVKGQGPIIRPDALRGATYFLFLAALGLMSWTLVENVRRFTSDPIFPAYVKQYGLRAMVLLDFAGALWLIGAFGFCIWQFVDSLQCTVRAGRQLS